MRCLFQHGDLLGLSSFSDFETRRICVGPMLNLNAKDAFDFAVVGYHKRRGNQTGLVLQGVTDTRHCQCNSRHNLFVRSRHHVIASRCLFIYLFINSQKNYKPRIGVHIKARLSWLTCYNIAMHRRSIQGVRHNNNAQNKFSDVGWEISSLSL